MGRFSGQEDWSGPKGPDRRNKGVLRAYRVQKRAEAEARQRSAAEERRLWEEMHPGNARDGRLRTILVQNRHMEEGA